MINTIVGGVIFALLSMPGFAATDVAVLHACPGQASRPAKGSGHDQPSQLCHRGHLYSIVYKGNSVTLHSGKRGMRLHKIPKGYEPEKIGAEGLIAFLPVEKQPYKDRDILLYTTAIRTKGGGGGGQCGSGAEIYLHALNLGKKTPHVLSRTLIGSCAQSIELDEHDVGAKKFGALTVKDGRLCLKFLNYKAMEGSPTAFLAHDFQGLDFKKATISSFGTGKQILPFPDRCR